MIVHQLPARTDNYIYILRDDAFNVTIVIDPTDSAPVFDYCRQREWTINHILITHHHPDHITGVEKIADTYGAQTWGFSKDQYRLPPLTNPLENGQSFSIGKHRFEVIHTPCHTLGHICYYMPDLKYLFSGDLIFSMGCGRFFEGTAEMALPHFEWLRSLPQDTSIFCSHEYTQVNTEFALSLEPNNDSLNSFYKTVLERRAKNQPTVPFKLKTEIALNPILRWDDKDLRTALHMETATSEQVLHAVRSQRNEW